MSIVAVAAIIATAVVGASAFTTASITRETTINVVSDDDGVIALIDGNAADIVQADSSTGELTIDFAIGSGSGVNDDATYTLGDAADPSYRAFNITNQDTVSHSIELEFTVSDGTSGIGDSEASVTFEVFDASGSLVATEDEESGTASFTAASGESFAVVLTVDTTMSSVDQTDDLSGTLNITAT